MILTIYVIKKKLFQIHYENRVTSESKMCLNKIRPHECKAELKFPQGL